MRTAKALPSMTDGLHLFALLVVTDERHRRLVTGRCSDGTALVGDNQYGEVSEGRGPHDGVVQSVAAAVGEHRSASPTSSGDDPA